MNRSNEQERKVVAETNRLNHETTDRLGRIERQLEHTTQVSTIVKVELHSSSTRLEKVERDAEGLLSSTKTAHKLLNRLRRWGASRHVGRHGRAKISPPKRTNHEQNGVESTSSGSSRRIEELLNEVDVNADILGDGVQEQRTRLRDMEQQIVSDTNTVKAAAKNSEASDATCSRTNNITCTTEENTAEQDAALDRIGNLLDGLHDQAKEYASILDSQKNGLDKIEDTIEPTHTSLQMINHRLRI
mmetsp:Transcript_17243/g.34574  ORF Transcript_17243/g.34574 Transcript_17243/m.34574 type:complete len:245 (+) Transcript_17243:82-816(+)